MNIGQFTKLVEGRVPAHTTMDLDHQGFFLAGARGQVSWDWSSAHSVHL